MTLTTVEQKRTGLVQFMIILIMTFLALIVIVSWSSEQGLLIKGLVLLALLTCLYVMAKERSLKKLHSRLVKEVADKQRQVNSLGEELEAEKLEASKLEHRLKELTSLYRAISAVNAVSEYQQTFDAVLLAAVDLVGGDCGSIMMTDRPNDRLMFASATGLDENVLSSDGLPLADGIAGWVATNAEPVLLKGPVGNDERFRNLKPREPEMDVAISVPLQLGGSVIGVLNLGSTVDNDKQVFLEEDLRFTYIFAQHAAVAIERAQLLEEGDRLREMVSTS